MDWFGPWEPVPYADFEAVAPSTDAARFVTWLIVAMILLMPIVIWYWHRVVRHSFWCAAVERDVEVRFRRGAALSCSAFEDGAAIACTRRCVDRTFRVQWPPALPALTRPRGART